jgi:hypothetical protein
MPLPVGSPTCPGLAHALPTRCRCHRSASGGAAPPDPRTRVPELIEMRSASRRTGPGIRIPRSRKSSRARPAGPADNHRTGGQRGRMNGALNCRLTSADGTGAQSGARRKPARTETKLLMGHTEMGSVSRGNNPVSSPWLAAGKAALCLSDTGPRTPDLPRHQLADLLPSTSFRRNGDTAKRSRLEQSRDQSGGVGRLGRALRARGRLCAAATLST